MCGIAGIVAPHQLGPLDADAARRMSAVLEHRGPDDQGFHLDDQAALAHRRLSIVDLGTGHQPLANEDRSIWIVFNGEIYNHLDLRRTLEGAGHRYRTRSDTETIVHAYEHWGDDAVTRLRGMFAFAIWDSRRGRLLIARDRLGVKPLYWARAGSRLLFASEIKSLLASGLLAASPNEDALPELLTTRYVSGERTMFRGIHKLLPGHTLAFDAGRLATRRYWDVPVRTSDADGMAEAEPGGDARLVARFRELLEESVRLRLMSDVPLGVFLSGGIDSSAIAAVMARQVKGPIDTFSVAFGERAFSELAYSRQVADAIGARRHEVVIGDREFFGALPRLVWHEDEPIAHPSSVPLYFVSALAREHVTVVLTGEGSDELLAGYGKYPRALWNWTLGSAYARSVPASVRGWLAAGVSRLPGQVRRRALRTFLAVEHTPAAVFFDNFAAIPVSQLRRLTGGAIDASPAAAYGASLEALERHAGRTPMLDRVLYADLKTYLVELLMKQDQMSMAASIESRVPFLDHVLVEFAARLPTRLKLSGFATKRVLRLAAADWLPREILKRPKMGFPVPFGHWTRGRWAEWAREILVDRRARERGLFDTREITSLIDRHVAGTADASDALWSLVNLEVWYRTFIDGDGVQVLPEPPAGARRPAEPGRVAPAPWPATKTA